MEKIYEDIIEVCKKPQKIEDIYAKLPQYTKKQLKPAFNELINLSKLLPARNKAFASLEFFSLVEAKFCATDKGYGFGEPVEALKSGRDIFIPGKFTKNAWHGDTVLVKLLTTRFKKDKRGDRQEGQIAKIITRAGSSINGVLEFSDGTYYLRPDIKKFPFIIIEDIGCATLGDKIAVNVSYYGNAEYMPQGQIIKIFGISGSRDASVNAILHTHNINRQFPQEVMTQTESIPQTITKDMFGNRLDLTDLITFTIDGEYSKDFDDAVSLEYLDNGNYKLGVHIADVSHYVAPKTALDDEAIERGTSVYFANQVIPMLPFELSTGICSLNPHENRFAMTAFMELDKNGNVLNSTFHKTVINSKHRLTYNKVNDILAGDASLREEYAQVVDILVDMNTIAEKMENRRLSKGSLDLEIPECYIITDEDGKPVDVKLRTRGKSEKLIEQFMVLANETVAEYMSKNEIPSVYRVHEPPNQDKLKVFADVSRLFGFKVSNDDLENPVALQSVLNQSKDTPHHKIVATMLLRSLSRARYDEQCIGHNGLASEYYLHFTSPIRRYPDLVVHRMLSKKIENEQFKKDDTDFVEFSSKKSTEREKHADDASRDIEKIYFAEYMSQFIGDEFTASVSGVQNFGIFVELPNTIEGLIRIDALKDDHYVYEEDHIRLVGKNSGKIYTIGTELRVKLINASPVNGQIDFSIVE